MTLTDSGKRVLVTGINGFTGRYMAASLSQAGYQVFGTATQAAHEVGIFQLDLCDREAVSRVVQEV
ncbi:MAG TPA: NAD-dependent epimerase/dehydratase family protein, partial [Pseudomonadales bacterium]|nr:NAD-dependent epimerase/dehydratase family protein [Pseudomonadales bacterium]